MFSVLVCILVLPCLYCDTYRFVQLEMHFMTIIITEADSTFNNFDNKIYCSRLMGISVHVLYERNQLYLNYECKFKKHKCELIIGHL